jgi:hypothetical protein
MDYLARYFWTDEIKSHMDNIHYYTGAEHVKANRNAIKQIYDDMNLIIYYNHGNTDGIVKIMSSTVMKNDDIYLNNPIIIDVACATCYWSRSYSLFCAQTMKRGALGFQGAVDVSYWNREFDETLNGFFLEGKAIGTAYKESRNVDYELDWYNYCKGARGDIYYAWRGDPTITYYEVHQ